MKHPRVFLAGALVLSLTLVWFALLPAVPAYETQAARCATQESETSAKIACWYTLIEEEVEARGILGGMEVFSHVYDTYEPFVETGCHTHAHKVGDMVYYGTYLANPDLRALEFPQSVTACGYGFFHGFLEHLIEDNPTPAFARETCAYLTERLSVSMRDIGIICFHGSGHGFALAHGAHVPEEEWGNIAAFSQQPITLCNELYTATEHEREECRQGVFNVLINWADAGDYGFTYDRDDPLAFCDGAPSPWRHACLYEAAQKYDRPVMKNPTAAFVRATRQAGEHAGMVFSVASAGVVQQTIADGTYRELAERCFASNMEEVAERCGSAIVHGLFEHGSPQKEHETALSFCADAVVPERRRAWCYREISTRLLRFHEQSRAQSLCGSFPREYEAECKVVTMHKP